MAEAFVELGVEGVNYITEKHWDKVHDTVTGKQNPFAQNPFSPKPAQAQPQSAVNRDPNQPSSDIKGKRRRQKNRLPSPEGPVKSWDKENYRYRRESIRSESLDRESERSERVIRAYEADPRDPPVRPESVLSKRDLKKLHRDREKMSYANGYGNNNLQAPQSDYRRNSQPPPKSRYYDDDDSDYDERTGRRYRTTGRGYDDYEDDKKYDREVVTTERYRGPARQGYDRQDSYQTTRDGAYGGAAAGAVTQYRKSTTEVDDYRSRRSQSRGRRDRDRDRSRSRSRSSSRSSSRNSGIRGKIDETFDTSLQGLGVGLAGAVVGGLAGREFGHKHRQRDIILGALVGGLGANAAENKWRDWKDDKKRDIERDEEKWEQRWEGRDRSGDGRDYRSRSAMR